MSDDELRQRGIVLSTAIDSIDWSTALARIETWARSRASRYVCLCNAHSLVTASRDPTFNQVLMRADMALPDGAPVAWMLRHTGFPKQTRIGGPDLMWRYCALAAESGTSIYLLGGTAETLQALSAELRRAFPKLRLCGAAAPAFRPLEHHEESELIAQVNAAGPGVVFVSLGCPKQERAMAAWRGNVHSVMIGVGAAFDFHAGKIPRAPIWMRTSGLEWLHRLVLEPRRLWRRYFVTNTAFVVGALRQLLTLQRR